MKKNDYISTLKSHLTYFSETDRQEILSDIDDHFSNGIREGKTEDDIASALGDPAIIASQYNQSASDSNTNENRNINNTTVNVNTAPSKTNIGNIIILIILNLCLASWILPTAISIVFGFWMTGICITIASLVVIFSSLFTVTAIGAIGIFVGIGLGCLGILICIGMFYLTKLLVKVCIIYFKWNVKFAKGAA